MSLRVPLLSVDEVRELGRVPDEEDWSVVEHPIEVTLVCFQFDSKTTRITGGIGRAGFTADRRKTNCGANFLADRFEESSRGDVTDVVGDLKVAMSTSASGMDLK